MDTIDNIMALADALMEVIEKSDCPLISSYRKEVAEKYADMWADEVEDALQ